MNNQTTDLAFSQSCCNATADAYTYLPVQNRGLPLGNLVNVLQPPLPLVDLLSDVPHYCQGCCHVSIVTVDTACT